MGLSRSVGVTTCLMAVVLTSVGCSSGSNIRPGPTPPATLLDCGFVPAANVNAALGGGKLLITGSPTHAAGAQRNADGGTLLSARCLVNTSDDADALSVTVTPIGQRRDLDAQVVALGQSDSASYHFPEREGVGGGDYQASSVSGFPRQAGKASVLWGNWNVTVVIDAPATGRDAVKDAVAITHQVTAQLKLPTGRTLAPLAPTPTR